MLMLISVDIRQGGCAGANFIPSLRLALLWSANGNRRLESDRPCANRKKNTCNATQRSAGSLFLQTGPWG